MRVRGLSARAGALILVAGGVCAASAIAGMGAIPDNQYEGRAEGDSTTYVGFDVVKQNGKRKVARVTALLHYHCQGGDGGTALGRAKGRIKVKDNGRFRGTVSLDEFPKTRSAPGRGIPSDLSYLFRGKLKPGGQAKGRIDANLFLAGSPRGDASIRCYTGDLDWRAKKGAEVEPTPLP